MLAWSIFDSLEFIFGKTLSSASLFLFVFTTQFKQILRLLVANWIEVYTCSVKPTHIGLAKIDWIYSIYD